MSIFLLPALAIGGVLYMEMNKDEEESSSSEHRRAGSGGARGRSHKKRRRFHDDDDDDPPFRGEDTCGAGGMCPSGGGDGGVGSSPMTPAANLMHVSYSNLPGVSSEGEPVRVFGPARETTDEAVRRSVAADLGQTQYKGLDNKMHTAEYFLDHQNPTPFAKPKQEGFLANSESSAGLRLDARTGESRLRITKKELGTFFEPTQNARNQYGAPSATNEIQARMMESVSKRMDGVNPLGAPIMVGPGINRNQAASNMGFNAANEFRDLNGGKGYVKTVDELRVKSKANLANKEGLQGVAEMPHKVYNMQAGVREGRDRPREQEISMGHWTATSTARTGHMNHSFIAGLESKKKVDDSSMEYFGASSAPHQLKYDNSKEARDECRRKGNEGAPMYLGNAGYLDQSNGGNHRGENSRPMNHRSFNEKYLEGDEGTFYGAATDMLKGAFVHFFGGEEVHTKKEERVGNPRPLFNADATQRIGGTINDPKAFRDNVSFKEMNHFSYVGNPNRGQHSDAYLTASITEALPPREMQEYLDAQELRKANATATASVPQPRFEGTIIVPTNASLTKEAYDVLSARGIGGGNMAKVNTLGHTMGEMTSRRSEETKRETANYKPTPNMAWADQNMARHALFGESTKTQKENLRAVDQRWNHPSEDFQKVEHYMNENPFLISRSKYISTVSGSK